MTSFDYFTCDTTQRANARSAKQSNLAQGVHVFVRTREDGVGTVFEKQDEFVCFPC